MVTSAIYATVTLLKERILLVLTLQATAPLECWTRRGCGLLVESAGDSTGGCAHDPTAMLCFCSSEQSDVGSLIETQKSHWNEKNDVTVWEPDL